MVSFANYQVVELYGGNIGLDGNLMLYQTER